jgi:hypothetical protein
MRQIAATEPTVTPAIKAVLLLPLWEGVGVDNVEGEARRA